MKSGTALECAVIAFIAYGFLRAMMRIITVKRRGVEAVGRISRMEEHETTDGDGLPMTSCSFYVQFETREGRLMGAELSNSSQQLAVGGHGPDQVSAGIAGRGGAGGDTALIV